ncbi:MULTISPECIES: hypothetical protein [unclassified Caulobacter]|uniref:hypothetical protein n=1 Tax=unclassified Caulobacter TaxID=2648921 RepID=UPI0011B83B1E|nr:MULTISPECIES: hypothetical protein [unclassified Caulobacter]
MNGSLKAALYGALAAAGLAVMAGPAAAASMTAVGKIRFTQGHENPACRVVELRKTSDGSSMYFRIPNTEGDGSIMAVTLTALASNLTVEVTYDPAVTTGCGSDPKIQYITIYNPAL